MQTCNSIPTMPLATTIVVPPGVHFEPNAIYSQQDLARLLVCDERTIRRYRKLRRGRLPLPFFLGRKAFWRGQALIEWCARRQQEAA